MLINIEGLQRFQPSETEKREVVRVLVILVLEGGGGGPEAFCLKICDVLAQQDKFSTDIAITYGCL